MGLCNCTQRERRYAPEEMAMDLPLELLREDVQYNKYDLLPR